MTGALATRFRHDERGAVLVLIALALPVLILVASAALDVGNWFEHKRHLQMQADAGALGGGALFNECFVSQSGGDVDIVAEAKKYAGDPTAATRYNDQVGGSSVGAMHVYINSKTFVAQPPAPDNTVELPPCEASMLDVKLSEVGPKLFFGVGGFVSPTIDAHARVEIHQLSSISGSLPIGVPDVNPRAGKAYFINEANGAVLGSSDLAQTGTSAGLTIWSSASAFNLNVSVKQIGVRLAFSGQDPPINACTDALVECYDLQDPTKGVFFVHEYDSAGTGSAAGPLVRDVYLAGGSCANQYFDPNGGCTVGTRAKIDFGSGTAGGSNCTVNPESNPIKASVTAIYRWGNNKSSSTSLSFNAASCTWTPNAYFTLPKGVGPVRIDLDWNSGTGKTKASGTFAATQGTYSGDDTVSGPVKVVALWEGGGPTTPSFTTGSSHNVTVRVGVLQNLKNAQTTSDPLVSLKLAGGGSRQHSIDCEPSTNLQEQLTTGCHPTYKIDRPPATNPAVNCPATYPNKAALFASSNATGWPCVGIQTGGTTGQVRQGMTNRVLAGGTCAQHPNNWASFPNFSPGDTRILPLFLTAFGAFSGNGNSTTVPVTDFATFYVTGFGVCSGDDTTPGNGYIVGHFIKYIAAPGSGGGTLGCDVTSFGSCVTVLTQ